MSIEGTHNVYRQDAIDYLEGIGVDVFDSDSNERIEHMLYENRESLFSDWQFINFEVVDYKQSEETPENEWPWWK